MELLKQVNKRVSIWKNYNALSERGYDLKYEVHVDSISEGDPVYVYATEKGAKIAAAHFAKIYNK